jgi:biopolymer transport protein ExbD
LVHGKWQTEEKGNHMEFFKKLLKEEDSVDLTPMIDVTFLLLIYFMVTTMLKQPEAELSIQLPGKPANSDLKPMPMLSVEIGDYGQIILNGSEIEQAETSTGAPNYEMLDLVANLKQQKSMRDQLIASGARSKEEAELKVQIESSGIAEHQSSISVLNACSTAGIEKITFAFE